MKMNRLSLGIAAIVAASTLTLAGCGGNDEPVEPATTPGDTMDTMREDARQGAEATQRSATEAYDTTRDAASDAYDSTRDAASDAYDRTRDAASDAADAARDRANQAGDTMEEWRDDARERYNEWSSNDPDLPADDPETLPDDTN